MPQLVSLLQMRNTVRRMTARYTPQQMPDSQVDYYLNLYLTLHFPLQFKNIKLTKPYVFYTVPNVDTYTFVYENGLTTTPAGDEIPGNIQISPPVYCQGYLLNYFQDKTQFYNIWPKLSVNQQISTGTGDATDTYSGTIPSFPFLRAQQDIFGNVTEAAVYISCSDDTGFSFVLTDVPFPNNNTGDLVGQDDVIYGQVNYLTGAYTFNLVTTALPAGQPIYASVVPYQASRPISTLFYDQQIVLRPVPLQVYQIEFQVSQQPTQLIADLQAPELDEWYQLICAGASMLIYADFPDPQGKADLQPTYDEQLKIAQRRTLRQLSSQRVNTIFSQRGSRWSLAGQMYGAEYSGGF